MNGGTATIIAALIAAIAAITVAWISRHPVTGESGKSLNLLRSYFERPPQPIRGDLLLISKIALWLLYVPTGFVTIILFIGLIITIIRPETLWERDPSGMTGLESLRMYGLATVFLVPTTIYLRRRVRATFVSPVST